MLAIDDNTATNTVNVLGPQVRVIPNKVISSVTRFKVRGLLVLTNVFQLGHEWESRIDMSSQEIWDIGSQMLVHLHTQSCSEIDRASAVENVSASRRYDIILPLTIVVDRRIDGSVNWLTTVLRMMSPLLANITVPGNWPLTRAATRGYPSGLMLALAMFRV